MMTREEKCQYWMDAIRIYLDEFRSTNPDYAMVARARAKIPFLDWVLSGKVPLEFFPPDPPPKPPDSETPEGGIPAPGQPAWFDRWGDLLLTIVAKLDKLQ